MYTSSHDEFITRIQESCLFASSGYSIENYALAEPEEMSQYFGDLFSVGSDISKWNESIMLSIKCFYILSISYFLENERSAVNYHLVRASGGEFFNSIITQNIKADKYLDILKSVLVNNSIAINSYNDLKNHDYQDAMKIDGKLVSKCIRLALYSCGCSISDFSNKEINRRLVHMIGVKKYASHLSNAVESLQ